MKITTMNFHILDEDFGKYQDVLVKMGWQQPRKHILRKEFGNTNVEIREYFPAFGSNVELVVTFYNSNGCSVELVSLMLKELKEAAHSTDES